MNAREAVQKLVGFVDSAPAWDETAAAARIVLQELKARDLRLREIEGALNRMSDRVQEVLG